METVYRKVKSKNGRVTYVPCGTDVDVLGDGIWYVRTRPGVRSTTSVEYITELLKIGMPEKMTVPEICGLYDVAEAVLQNEEFQKMLSKSFTTHDLAVKVVSIAIDYMKNNKKKKDTKK
jgi:hypothetical protein